MRLLKITQIYSFFFIALAITACNNKKHVDVSNINLQIKVKRFDQDFGKMTAADLPKQAAVLQKKYGSFYSDYISGMLSAGNVTDTAYYANLRLIFKNPDYLALKEAVAQKFPDLSETDKQLTDAFKHLRYYYPKQEIPQLVSFYSGFAVQTPVGNNYIGIGLDMFLGTDSKFYPALVQSIPHYLSVRFTPENITPRVMEAFIREDMFPEPDNARSLLDKMVYNGKIFYMMDALMPDTPDSIKIGYSAKQMDWSTQYESSIWAYFLEQNLLYETDYMKIQKFLSEAPFTPGIGDKNESSPKLGFFTGWQIVKKYMDGNPDVTLQQLMKDTDYQRILNKSKYKPR